QNVGQEIYERIQTFVKRQKHTHAEIASLLGAALKRIDWSDIKTLAIEDLKHVKKNKRGTFSRQHNRRLSHWLYACTVSLLERVCEEQGVLLVRKHPAYTSQFCRKCSKWDKRSRVAEQFLCVYCGHCDH